MQRLKPRLLIVTLLLLQGAGLWASDELSRERAMSNPVLWSHFRQVALDSRMTPGRRGRRSDPARVFALDAQTRNLIRSFLKRVESQSERLRLNSERMAFLAGQNEPPAPPELRASVVGVEKAAAALRDLLSPVFLDINRNVKTPQVEVPRIDGPADFYQAVEILGGEAFSARRKVENYVFGGNNTVSIYQLGNSNMLVSLARVRKMARSLQKYAAQ